MARRTPTPEEGKRTSPEDDAALCVRAPPANGGSGVRSQEGLTGWPAFYRFLSEPSSPQNR